ncbi:hypothetical protein L596_019251 [Steinernema carpocapsae]|uniref:Uncharacterized protein n=1 Tax=Steinernema carpocapsae TaxID=34508 RepID=A0A4U5MPZ0_STECR|nr:hypothetical protein L596_019251 [Steinernema carpocapsae]
MTLALLSLTFRVLTSLKKRLKASFYDFRNFGTAVMSTGFLDLICSSNKFQPLMTLSVPYCPTLCIPSRPPPRPTSFGNLPNVVPRLYLAQLG